MGDRQAHLERSLHEGTSRTEVHGLMGKTVNDEKVKGTKSQEKSAAKASFKLGFSAEEWNDELGGYSDCPGL
ncbi:MAG: hypothetical protein JRJ39_05250 [Deltaproteobacteria bacterium]|nr:hypothetical protein [Deltaproteobacteria bacterium]